MRLTRRDMVVGAAAATLPATSFAAAPLGRAQAPGFYRYRIGEFELTAINDGIWYRPIEDGFVRNVAHGQVQQELVAGYMQPDFLPTYFTALAVNTGSRLVLIDTGTGGQYPQPSGTFLANLVAAGIESRAVDAILISHLHADHINGIKTKDNELVFPNAEIMLAESEWDYWMDEARLEATPVARRVPFLNARRVLRDRAKDIRRFTPGRELVPGITSVSSIGHTPGHTSYLVSSGNASVLVLGDVTNHPWLFLRHPEWRGSFDVQPDVAVATRKAIFDRIAADRQLVQGYHFPFPGLGYVAKTAGGYEFVPRAWETPL